MNKKSQNLLGQFIIFLGSWLITSIVWSIWLDGIFVPIAGCFTSLAVIGAVNFSLHLHR